MLFFAFLILAAIAVLTFLVINLDHKVQYILDRWTRDADDICRQLFEINMDVANARLALAEIREAVNQCPERDTSYVVCYHYRLVLYFVGCEIASKVVVTLDSVGPRDEIEILPRKGSEESIAVMLEQYTQVYHPIGGLPEIHREVGESIDPFRDRLLSEGWTIDTPDADNGEDDEVASRQAEDCRQGQ